jgi:nucleotidyltransferase substrate binding protein (TIGR01987 family)
MDSARLFQRIADYRKALTRLHEALEQSESDLVRDAAIQRFEFTFELAWKAMKLFLEFKGIDARGPKDALREALAQGLISDGNAWTELLEQRNLTSHTYDEGIARGVFSFVRAKGAALFDGFAAEIAARTGPHAP